MKKNVRKPKKEEVVNVRMTRDQKALFEAAAVREGLGLSTWMLHTCLAKEHVAAAAAIK